MSREIHEWIGEVDWCQVEQLSVEIQWIGRNRIWKRVEGAGVWLKLKISGKYDIVLVGE